MKHGLKKRILSLVLCISMVLPMVAVPMPVYSVESEESIAPITNPFTPETIITFPDGTTAKSQSYRIPSMVTLADGTIVASADIRWNTTYDGGGLDTLVAYSKDNGATWSYTLANYLNDNGNKYNALSSSFIDASLAVDRDGQTIYMLCDLYAGGVALNGNGTQMLPYQDSGFTDEGYLKLSYNFSNYTEYLKDGKIYYENGEELVGYTVDSHFNLYQNGTYVSNLFFYDSPVAVYPTAYLYLTKSTDGGKTWSDPTLLDLKSSSENACLVSPGDAITTKDGSIVFPVYSYNGSESSQKMGFIYSKDSGVTWQRSANYEGAETFSSEASVVELENGNLRFFYRNKNAVLTYADFDMSNGISNGSWGKEVKTSIPVNSNTQLSAITYSKTSNGKQVVLVSCPTGPDEAAGSTSSDGSNRTNGKIHVFTVDKSGTMEHVKSVKVNDYTATAQLRSSNYTEEQGFFAYSSLAERKDGSIAILYENNQFGWGAGDGKYYTITADAFHPSSLGLTPPVDVDNQHVTILDQNGNSVSGVTVSEKEKCELTAYSSVTQITSDISYQWQVEYESGKWVDIYGENEDVLSLSYGMIVPLADQNGAARVRCVSTAGSHTYSSNPITVTLNSVVGGTDIDPTADIQKDGVSADSITTTYGNDSFAVKLSAATNLTGILSYRWAVLSDAKNNNWTEISAGSSCTVKYADLDFEQHDSDSDVSYVQLIATNGNLSATDTFAIYRVTEVTVSNSSGTANGTVDVTVSGKLPENATLNLTDASGTQIGGVDASEIALALDVTITQDSAEWQPAKGESVRVSIPASQLDLEDGDYFTVYHIHDGATELLGPFQVANGYATFEIDGFSVVVISTNYGAAIGATTEFCQQMPFLYPSPDSFTIYPVNRDDMPEKLIITDYYFDSANGRLFYKLDAAPGYAWPESCANYRWCESGDLTDIDVNGTGCVFDKNGDPVENATVTTSSGVIVSATTSLQSADISYQWQVCYDRAKDQWVNISGENEAEITLVAGMVISLVDENNEVLVRCVTKAGTKTVITAPITVKLGDAQEGGDDFADILIDGKAVDSVEVPVSDLESFMSSFSVNTSLTGDLTYSWEVLFDVDFDMWWLHGQSENFNPVFDPYKTGTYLDSNYIYAVDDTTSAVNIRLTVSNGDTVVRDNFVIYVKTAEVVTAASYARTTESIAVYRLNSGVAPVADTDIYSVAIHYWYNHNMEIAAPSYTSTTGASTEMNHTEVFPTVQGYLPYVMDEDGNLVRLDSYTFSGYLTEDFELNVYYQPALVSYTINIYQQNADDDNYELFITRQSTALTGTVIDSIVMNFPGFYQTKMTTNKSSVAADGSTVFNLYYDRIYYLMKFELDGGYGVQPVYARHGTTLNIPNPLKAGYSFVGWDNITTGTGDRIADTLPDTMPIGNTTYKAIWKASDNAKVTIVYWGENPNDEGYSYKESVEIYAKVGSTLTFGDNRFICTLEEHTHTEACETLCKYDGHQHNNACYGNCKHKHAAGCYSVTVGNNFATLTEVTDTSTINDLNNSTPWGNGVVRTGWFLDYDYYIELDGVWYELNQGVDSNSVVTVTTNNCEHAHTNTCLDCSLHVHDASCYPCIAHTHTNSCYLKTPTGDQYDSAYWTLRTDKNETVTVAADGSTIMNVYYDRTTFTLTFKGSSNYGGTNTTYGTITDKWGADIETEFFEICKSAYESDGTYSWSEKTGGGSPWTSYVGVMPQRDITYYAYDASGTMTAYYYFQTFNGDYNDAEGNVLTVKAEGSGFTVTDEDRAEFEGFTHDKSISTGNGSSFNNANFYYTRNNYILEFNNGERIVKTEIVPYQANLGSYAFTPAAPSFYEAGSVEFDGWYQNPECTGDKVILSETTMSASNMILYAKWVPVNHDVTIYRYKNADGSFPTGNDIIQETIRVPHGSFVQQQYIPEEPTNGSYTFVGWFYIDGNTEKAFDFANMPVTKDLQIYAKWSSNVQIPYTIKYVLQGTDTEIAERETGKQFAGETLTFQAKTGAELYDKYQEGYYPTLASHSIDFDLETGEESFEFTFEYVYKESVPYTVYYLAEQLKDGATNDFGTVTYDGKTYYRIAKDKTVVSTHAMVTENFAYVEGYMPNAYQQSLVLNAVDDTKNVIYFFYTVDTEHAYYKVSHYTENLDGSWYEYSSYESVGVVGTIYSESPKTITGFTYAPGTAGTLTSGKLTDEGLHLQLFYTRNKYPYKVEYRIEGAGTLLGTDLFTDADKMEHYSKMISVEATKTFSGYHLVTESPSAHTIRIEQAENMSDPVANVIIFYYAEDEVTINYEVVGPTGCGTVNPTSQTVQVISGNPMSTATASGAAYKFVGWYKDQNCTELITTERVITPEKVNGLNVAATYYAMFEYNLTSLTIKKEGVSEFANIDPNQTFIFNISGNGIDLDVTVHGSDWDVVVDGLTVGATYTITEKTDWSWRYNCTGWKYTGSNANVNGEGNKASITLGLDGTIIVTNERSNEQWLDGDSWCNNLFK